tara:strand:+ start:1267 stop:2079 length:813 start_codon:yes stop_codon:yes gene_type:complete
MKKVIVLTADRFQPDVSGFILEYVKLGCKIDGVLILNRQKGIIYHLRGLIKIYRAISLDNFKNNILKSICFFTNKSTLSNLKKTWGVQGGLEELKKIDIVDYARSIDVPVYFRNQFNAKMLAEVTNGQPTLFPLYAGGILSPDVLSTPNIEFINAHMGKMPRYRGYNVIEWAIYENQPPKVNIMVMNESIDGGDVIYEKSINTSGVSSIKELRKTGYEHCYLSMAEGIDLYSKGKVTRTIQSKGARYYYRMHPVLAKQLESKIENVANKT